MKVLAMGDDGTYTYLVVENHGMFYALGDDDGSRIETPDSAYKFGGYIPYDGGLSQERLKKIKEITDEIGDDLPDWYKNAEED